MSMSSKFFVIRCGIMIGTRVWMRMRRTWGILPRVARPSSNSSSSNINGSPPLRITSEMLRSRAIASFHVAHLRGLSSASVCNSWRRKQNRQWTLHEWFAIISALPWNFPNQSRWSRRRAFADRIARESLHLAKLLLLGEDLGK